MKKILSLMLAATMACTVLVGCSNADSKNNDDSSKGSSDTFQIGGIGPITGDAAIYGQAVKNGAEIAIEEINADGGVNGYKLQFDFQDDENDAEKSINAYNTLKDNGMDILLGTVTSTPSIAVADKTHADNIFQLTPSGSAVEIVQNDNVFRVCFSDPNQGIGAAAYIGQHKLATKVAVIYDSSSVYSSGIYEKFTAEAKNQNLEIVSAEAFTSESNKDFSVQLQKAKDSGAELVFLPIYYSEASLILTQAGAMDYSPIFFGCDGLDGILGVKNFDTSLAEGTMLLTPFAADAEDELTKSFVASYKEKFDEVPNQFAADAYDGVYIIAAAIEKAGVTPEMTPSEICDGLKVAMTEITIDGLTGLQMTWDASGEPNKAPKAVKIVDGAYKAAE
ncbi:ABC transporter substrate-binding protein [Alloiococcus sp. CFN-8]|uniref:ABC transporter substrate-binding protein n=1 Tax=Alloiococcus sp. CFN-8 TaxID=3416081 RepID=UPI003CF60548